MPEVYDHDYAALRIHQLISQCLVAPSITGTAIFRSAADENRLEIVTWTFGDDDRQSLKENGFQSLLLCLLDDLIIYRTRCGMADCREGYVSLSESKGSITWLKDGEGEALAAEHWAMAQAK